MSTTDDFEYAQMSFEISVCLYVFCCSDFDAQYLILAMAFFRYFSFALLSQISFSPFSHIFYHSSNKIQSIIYFPSSYFRMRISLLSTLLIQCELHSFRFSRCRQNIFLQLSFLSLSDVVITEL